MPSNAFIPTLSRHFLPPLTPALSPLREEGEASAASPPFRLTLAVEKSFRVSRPTGSIELHFAGELVAALGAGLTCKVMGAEYTVNVASLPGAFVPFLPGTIGLPTTSPCNAKV